MFWSVFIPPKIILFLFSFHFRKTNRRLWKVFLIAFDDRFHINLIWVMKGIFNSIRRSFSHKYEWRRSQMLKITYFTFSNFSCKLALSKFVVRKNRVWVPQFNVPYYLSESESQLELPLIFRPAVMPAGL